MPVYRIKCSVCFAQKDIFLKMYEYDNLPEHCGRKTERVICAPAVHADITPYVSPGTGKMITSRTEQREDLIRSNAIIREPGIEKDISRWGEEKKEKDFAPIAAGIDSAVRDLVNTGHIGA